MDTEEPPLPPNPELLNRQPKWFKPVFYGCIVASVLFVLAGLTAPMVVRSAKKSEQTEATSNLRQIGFALLEFDNDFGAYPNDQTKDLVNNKHPGHGLKLSGKSSNALFRQLFAADITRSEAMFYAQVNGTRKPDGDISPGESLRKGEVAFAYIAGLTSEGNPARVIAFCPIIPGTDRFDPKPFLGRDRLQPRQYRGFHAHPPPRFHRRFQRRHDPQPVPRIVGAIFGRPPFFRL